MRCILIIIVIITRKMRGGMLTMLYPVRERESNIGRILPDEILCLHWLSDECTVVDTSPFL